MMGSTKHTKWKRSTVLCTDLTHQSAEAGWQNASRSNAKRGVLRDGTARRSAGTLPAVSRASGLPRRAGSKPAIRQTGSLRYDPGAIRGRRASFIFKSTVLIASISGKSLRFFDASALGLSTEGTERHGRDASASVSVRAFRGHSRERTRWPDLFFQSSSDEAKPQRAASFSSLSCLPWTSPSRS